MSRFTYKINEETFEILAYTEGQDVAFLSQPDQPDGTPWASLEEATEWIEAFLADLEAQENAVTPAE